MKKGIASLVLALVLALGLCAGAAAIGSASRPGEVTGGGPSPAPVVWARDLLTNERLFAACYSADGRLTGITVLPGSNSPTRLSQADRIKLIRLNDDLVPQGAVLSFPDNYTSATKSDGEVTLSYGANGISLSQPVTEKFVGIVNSIDRDGDLNIIRVDGTGTKTYPFAALTAKDCALFPDKTDPNWEAQVADMVGEEYTFYVDTAGCICWVDYFDGMAADDVCLVLDAQASGGGQLQASILFADSDVQTVDVVRLNRHDITDADAAGRQLRARGKSTFYNWKRTPLGYELLEMGVGAGHESWDTPVSVGDGTSVVAQIFKESAFAKDPRNPNYPLRNMLHTYSKTVFIVGKELPSGEMIYTTYTGFKTVPEMNATIVTAVALHEEHYSNNVASYVYLQANQFKEDRPGGLVYISDNNWLIDPELYEDGVYLTNIVDTDGTKAQMRLPNRLKDAVFSNASMEIGRFPDNAYVGKFCVFTGIDENHVVTGLEPVDAADVSAFGNGTITTSAGTWSYDKYTRCVYVDLGWIDDLEDGTNTPGVREDTDLYRVNSSGTIGNPDSFFVPGDVSADPADKMPYRSVKAVIVSSPETPDLADYIYVVREIW